MVEQRWVRPEIYNVDPGHWKKQLPVKYLALAKKGDLFGLQDLLASHPDWINRRGSHNRTFLWEAARAGKVDVVSWLLDKGAEVDPHGSYNNESYVQLSPYVASIYYKRARVTQILEEHSPEVDVFRSVFLGDEDRVEQLLEKDPSTIHLEDPHDNIYYTPLLSFAVANLQTSMVSLLLARKHVIVPFSRQLMFLVALRNSPKMYNLLLENGMEPHYADGTFFVTVRDLKLMERAISDGVNINVRTNSMTPLMYLSRGDKGGNVDKVKLLLNYQPDLNSVDKKGRTALHYACRAGFADLVDLLLSSELDPMIKDIDGKMAVDLVKKNNDEVLSKF